MRRDRSGRFMPIVSHGSGLDLHSELATAFRAPIVGRDPVEGGIGMELDEISLALLPDAAVKFQLELTETRIRLFHRCLRRTTVRVMVTVES
jgi:hypothetical protein